MATDKKNASARVGIERAGDWLVNQLLAEPGVEERKSRFAGRPALFVRGKEFFHLDAPGLADVRVGRATVRTSLDELRADPRIELREGTSDWVQVRFISRKDAECALGWARKAIAVDG